MYTLIYVNNIPRYITANRGWQHGSLKPSRRSRARARLRIPFTGRFLGSSKAGATQWDSAEPRNAFGSLCHASLC